MIPVFFLTAIVLLLIGLPVSATVGCASIVYLLGTGTNPVVVAQQLFAGIDKVAFVAIPMFILAGDIMNMGGLAQRIVRFCSRFVGNIHGGLAIVTIIACMFFAAISGSGVATAAAMGAILVPSMVRAGYSDQYAAAVVGAASPIGVIIPPSISYIIYAVLANCSVLGLYQAGIPAGIVMGLALMLVSYVIARKRGYSGGIESREEAAIQREEIRKKRQNMTLLQRICDSSIWALITPVIIVGGVFGKIYTATESAVVAVLYSLFVGVFIYKGVKISDVPKIFGRSAIGAAKIMFVIANAQLFAYVISYAKLPQMILSGFSDLQLPGVVILLLINVILLIAGTFMETSAIILICTPIFLPVVTALGMSPIHFGIIITANTAIGLLTPPFGVCLFTSAGVAKIKVHTLFKEIMPFIGAMIAAILIITYCTPLIMFFVK